MNALEHDVRTGNYMAFDLNGEQYGIDATRVVMIISHQPCTPLPQARSYVKGLTMVRGKVIPVIDARMKLGMPETTPTPKTCIIMVSAGKGETGLVVDAVREVVAIAEEQFDPLHNSFDSDDVVGIAKLGNRLITVLDVDEMVRLS